ncbi:hypothetical protein Ocin01_14114 [Orchesella cincta]|uniref:Uncharacterized protein n=1 Tax=Orchesella cincta TaxID=48709 RepID=A0A1D2MI22_ORCCI|nr:hypothetical protein Ocin01_14114 [Orchesella cincta]
MAYEIAMKKSYLIIILLIFTLHPSDSVKSRENFQVVHFLDPGDPETQYYTRWNSDQWISWLRGKYREEAEQRRQLNDPSYPTHKLQGSFVNIIMISSFEDFKIAYASDSMPAYTDPQRSDYFWSDYAYPLYVIIRSPNATINVTGAEAANAEEHQTGQRTVYGYNVYNCAEKKLFVNAKIDPDTEEPVHFQTFFPKKVKNPKDKLRIPLSVCTKVSQKRGLLDEIRFQLGSNIL